MGNLLLKRYVLRVFIRFEFNLFLNLNNCGLFLLFVILGEEGDEFKLLFLLLLNLDMFFFVELKIKVGEYINFGY